MGSIGYWFLCTWTDLSDLQESESEPQVSNCTNQVGTVTGPGTHPIAAMVSLSGHRWVPRAGVHKDGIGEKGVDGGKGAEPRCGALNGTEHGEGRDAAINRRRKTSRPPLYRRVHGLSTEPVTQSGRALICECRDR